MRKEVKFILADLLSRIEVFPKGFKYSEGMTGLRSDYSQPALPITVFNVVGSAEKHLPSAFASAKIIANNAIVTALLRPRTGLETPKYSYGGMALHAANAEQGGFVEHEFTPDIRLCNILIYHNGGDLFIEKGWLFVRLNQE